ATTTTTATTATTDGCHSLARLRYCGARSHRSARVSSPRPRPVSCAVAVADERATAQLERSPQYRGRAGKSPSSLAAARRRHERNRRTCGLAALTRSSLPERAPTTPSPLRFAL